MNEKEFTAKDMIEFAKWFAEPDEITEKDVQAYRDHLKQIEKQEYELYLFLKAKYDNK